MDIFFSGSVLMEEIEIASWVSLDAVKKAADVVESIGNLQTGHSMSVFCIIEEDYFELCYSDSAANYLRRYEDRDEFEAALEERKEETGEAPYEEDNDYDEDDEEEEDEEIEKDAYEAEDEVDSF
jgi:hypothetical protein